MFCGYLQMGIQHNGFNWKWKGRKALFYSTRKGYETRKDNTCKKEILDLEHNSVREHEPRGSRSPTLVDAEKGLSENK